MQEKSPKALKTIREVADMLDLPQHVLRFWETRFPEVSPMKRQGNRRFYRPEDIEALKAVQFLLHEKGYTIKGAAFILPDVLRQKAEHGLALEEIAGLDINTDFHERPPKLTPACEAALRRLRDELVELRGILA